MYHPAWFALTGFQMISLKKWPCEESSFIYCSFIMLHQTSLTKVPELIPLLERILELGTGWNSTLMLPRLHWLFTYTCDYINNYIYMYMCGNLLRYSKNADWYSIHWESGIETFMHSTFPPMPTHSPKWLFRKQEPTPDPTQDRQNRRVWPANRPTCFGKERSSVILDWKFHFQRQTGYWKQEAIWHIHEDCILKHT